MQKTHESSKTLVEDKELAHHMALYVDAVEVALVGARKAAFGAPQDSRETHFLSELMWMRDLREGEAEADFANGEDRSELIKLVDESAIANAGLDGSIHFIAAFDQVKE